jgi:hypothetical protein
MVRIDAHATVGPDYVARAVHHLRSGRWGGVGGRVAARGVTSAGRAIATAMSSKFGIGNSVHHYGTEPVPADHVPFPGYPLTLVRQLGGWDEALPTNQDFELDYRIGLNGHRLLYDPEMVIDYRCAQSVRAVFRQFRRYGKGKAQVVVLHPRSLRARHFVAPALVAQLAVVAAATLVLRKPVVLALAAPYAGGVVAASRREGRSLDPAARRHLPLVFAAMHLSWGMGFWEGLFTHVRLALRRRPS